MKNNIAIGKYFGFLALLFCLKAGSPQNRQSLKVDTVKEFVTEMKARTNVREKEQTQYLEIEGLKSKVLNLNELGPRRRQSLYALTEIGTPAVWALAEILNQELPSVDTNQNPHSAETYKRQFELALRLTALETLDRLSETSLEARMKIENFAENSSDRSLRYLAQTSLDGIRTGRPKKLQRTIDAMIAERN